MNRRAFLTGLLASTAAVGGTLPAFASGGYVGGVDLGSGDSTIAMLRRGEFWVSRKVYAKFAGLRDTVECFDIKNLTDDELLLHWTQGWGSTPPIHTTLVKEYISNGRIEEETSGPPPPDARTEGRGSEQPHHERDDGVPGVRRAEPGAAHEPRGPHRHETPRVRQVHAQVPHARGDHE